MASSEATQDGTNYWGSLEYPVPAGLGGRYFIEVTAGGSAERMQGQYAISVAGASPDALPFEVASTLPAHGDKVFGLPSQFDVNFNHSILQPTLQASDFGLNQVPPLGLNSLGW